VSVQLQGVLGPVVTTFQPASGELDRVAFANNIRTHFAAAAGGGLQGIVVNGSTGEAPLLDERERDALVEAARDVVPGDRLLIAGTGAESTRTCVRLTRHAARRGADAVLVVAPHYYGVKLMNAATLRAHYWEIADKSPVPVVVYNIPKYMHFSLAPQLVAELAQHENIVGIKDSSGDLELLSAYLNAQSDRFAIMTGNGSTFKRSLEMGARGGILAVSLFAPALTLEVYESVLNGSPESMAAAERAQERLTPLAARIVGDMGVAGIKAALDRVGLCGGPVRSPLQSLGAAELAQLTELLRNAELSLAA
jgi:4-hydroxy-2-oxoglutarate aldolase